MDQHTYLWIVHTFQLFLNRIYILKFLVVILKKNLSSCVLIVFGKHLVLIGGNLARRLFERAGLSVVKAD